ncbi:hypothetical protein [Staphylococcus epidermidis]|uniref:hypothetical protein n=1 Tax=Staphylococcus epidermidis TaxID=1282 RepID=UPI0011A9A6C0|nr:hypothetical protein [Staphylococcus epidermidis]KAB2188035.1 hypothetical protein F9B33_11410 [Staphylococcus epidermidis]MCG1368884.1 hypothetical protein [Staphylococcus epidermidis]MDF1465009.1 hypothetical protein [Staphylococcus epidermidis]MDU2119630.1 hypothetical protein [Staphylococcus aureus]
MEKVNKTTDFIMNYLLICENIKDYRTREFEEKFEINEEIFDKNLRTPLAYTTLGDEEKIEVEVILDLEQLQMIQEVSFKYKINHTDKIGTFNDIKIDKFKDLNEVTKVTSHLNFDDLVFVDKDYEELYEEWNED